MNNLIIDVSLALTTRKSTATRMLELLNVVHENSDLTQRSMANQLGIALGLANTYLKRCIRKGYIKWTNTVKSIQLLTPTGFAEKSRQPPNIFRLLSTSSACESAVPGIARWARARNWDRLAWSALAILPKFMLCSLDHKIELAGVFDLNSNRNRFAGFQLRKISTSTFDALVITDTQSSRHFRSAVW